MSPLQLHCRREPPVVIISLRGRLDGNSSREFEQFVAQEIQADDNKIVLDATHLVFISSAGLRELMLLARKLGKKGGKASILGAAPLIRETLAMTGIDGLFLFADEMTAAQKAVKSEGLKVGGLLGSWFKGSS